MGITCITRTIDPSLRLAVFSNRQITRKMNTRNSTEEIVKKIVLFLFGKRIRKEFIKHDNEPEWAYKAFVASPLSEWRDRLWLLKHCPCFGERELKFLQQ